MSVVVSDRNERLVSRLSRLRGTPEGEQLEELVERELSEAEAKQAAQFEAELAERGRMLEAGVQRVVGLSADHPSLSDLVLDLAALYVVWATPPVERRDPRTTFDVYFRGERLAEAEAWGALLTGVAPVFEESSDLVDRLTKQGATTRGVVEETSSEGACAAILSPDFYRRLLELPKEAPMIHAQEIVTSKKHFRAITAAHKSGDCRAFAAANAATERRWSIDLIEVEAVREAGDAKPWLESNRFERRPNEDNEPRAWRTVAPRVFLKRLLRGTAFGREGKGWKIVDAAT